jgi:hypothetical protein
MKVVIIQSETVSIDKIESNDGQVKGLPKNPRFIKDAKFQKLKKSIQENPEMLGARELIVYPHKDKYVVIGGNMRYEALKDLDYSEIPCKILPKNFTPKQLRAIVIKDNVSYGEMDWEILANEWDAQETNDWGVDVFIPEVEIFDTEYTPETAPVTSYKEITERDVQNTEEKLNNQHQEVKKYIECMCPNCGSEFKIIA